MGSIILALPEKSKWYVHLFKDRDTKVVHAVTTIQRHYRRSPRSRAACGALVKPMWPRPNATKMNCTKCIGTYNAMDILLEDS